MSSEFKDIYNLWSRIHDENTAIIRHKKKPNGTEIKKAVKKKPIEKRQSQRKGTVES